MVKRGAFQGHEDVSFVTDLSWDMKVLSMEQIFKGGKFLLQQGEAEPLPIESFHAHPLTLENAVQRS